MTSPRTMPRLGGVGNHELGTGAQPEQPPVRVGPPRIPAAWLLNDELRHLARRLVELRETGQHGAADALGVARSAMLRHLLGLEGVW